MLAYLVLLRVEIARFTRTKAARLCCSDPHLTVERYYLLRCPVQSGRSSSASFRKLHQRRSGRLHPCIIVYLSQKTPARTPVKPVSATR